MSQHHAPADKECAFLDLTWSTRKHCPVLYTFNGIINPVLSELERDQFGVPIKEDEQSMEDTSYQTLRSRVLSCLLNIHTQELSNFEGQVVRVEDKKGTSMTFRTATFALLICAMICVLFLNSVGHEAER